MLNRIIPLVVLSTLAVACAKVVKSQNSETGLTSLAGTEWGLAGQDAPFVKFDAQGNMNGNSGCNNFGGSYELNGERLIVGPLMSTKKACFGGDIMQQESAFLDALQNAHHIDATHKSLVIFDENNAELLTLVRRDWD